MISLHMLPASPPFVKTGPTAAPGSQRVRRNRLTALGVLLVHALLLGLLWNSQPARIQQPAPQTRLIEVSVLAPSAPSTAGVQPPARQQSNLPAPAASKPPAAPAVSRQARSKAAAQAQSQKAASPRQDEKPALAAARSQAAAVSLDTASKANTLAASQSTAQQTSEAAPHRPADQLSGNRQGSAFGQAPATAAARVELPDASANYLDNPKPTYPQLSRRLGEQGQVMLRVWVEADGRPGKIEISRSSGFERLDRAALQAVWHWRFVPGKRAGVPEAMWVEVPLQFVLE